MSRQAHSELGTKDVGRERGRRADFLELGMATSALSPQSAGAGVDPRVRHRRNVARLDGNGVAVVSYPGAGAALLGNIILELGLDYVDPYTEDLDREGTARPAPDRVGYRRRLAASARRDDRGAATGETRFVKTHLLPEDFPQPRGVVLLVRDPRDTLFSYYCWRLAFSEEGERRDLRGFLESVEPLGLRPVDDWSRFHRLWTAVADTSLGPTTLVRFEELKSEPVNATNRLLKAVGVAAAAEDVASAVASSTFEQMRRHEDRNATGQPRIMRRGLCGEWKEWYHGEIADYFQGAEFRAIALHLGYVI